MTTTTLDKPTFTALLDVLIPARDESLPGAGSLGIGDPVEGKLGEALPLVASGLAALDDRARASGHSRFAEMPTEERVEAVSRVAEAIPGFVESLMFHAYGFYYSDPRVLVSLGLKSAPPFPGGYPLEQGDLGLLDSVRQRDKVYREV